MYLLLSIFYFVSLVIPLLSFVVVVIAVQLLFIFFSFSSIRGRLFLSFYGILSCSSFSSSYVIMMIMIIISMMMMIMMMRMG